MPIKPLTFTVSSKQIQKARRWMKSHACAKVFLVRRNASFVFSNDSGIGTSVAVQCDCKQQFDLTDYETW
jgi:hypothetical protein